jgi:hypothetical protein
MGVYCIALLIHLHLGVILHTLKNMQLMTTLPKHPSRFIALSFYLWIFITLMGCSPSNIEIVRDGVSNYEIVIPSEADSTIMHAAEELRHYVRYTCDKYGDS